ncbi:universal stress protein [Pacificoceanicola onchidii]|uniref:universal stress protein n=1 Tax=Pacificoceanicola onchidii TaxID=2562685 RepID=UPI0010A646FB|nr:universal stress protein [Pacificoceanicola onchidii]
MSVHNILVAFNGADSAVDALKYAASMAGDQAHVTALLAHSTHEVVNSRAAWVPAKAREIIAQANEDILGEVETRFEALRGTLGLGERLHFRRVAGRVDTVLAEAARSYDMLIIGQDTSEAVDDHVSLHPDRISLLSGRPILVVPHGYDTEARHTHAALVWDGSRAAARALSDSLGLLEEQGRVTVLTLTEDTSSDQIAPVMEHLQRHDVKAEHRALDPTPGPARALLSWCKDTDPCMLLMGAHEHSKFREDFLGGITTRVLRDAPTPVLLSH